MASGIDRVNIQVGNKVSLTVCTCQCGEFRLRGGGDPRAWLFMSNVWRHADLLRVRIVGGMRLNGRKEDACKGGASGALLGQIVTNYRNGRRQCFPPVAFDDRCLPGIGFRRCAAGAGEHLL